jgi:NAD(P)-dependent dehydrogenase (short-subunit alcohol dehydrogenase family)
MPPKIRLYNLIRTGQSCHPGLREYAMNRRDDWVVLITGASSGIGRAAARAFADEKASIVVTARDAEKLEQVVQECRLRGSDCIALACDTTRHEDVEALADQAVESFGHIDVWVNNAAVTGFGRIDEMPYELYRQIIETNLLGYIHGARAAVRLFRRQGSGVLINVASVAGKVGQPLTSAYCASKFGVVGLSDSIRMELRDEPNVHVCTVLPPSIDTPLFQHGANYAGRQAQPVPPVYSADRVARTIVRLAHSPRRQVAIGAAGKLLVSMHRLSPALTERFVARQVATKHFKEQTAPAQPGNVLEPSQDEFAVSGGWTEPESSPPRMLQAAIGAGAAVAAAFGIYALVSRARSRQEQQQTLDELPESAGRRMVPEGGFAAEPKLEETAEAFTRVVERMDRGGASGR